MTAYPIGLIEYIVILMGGLGTVATLSLTIIMMRDRMMKKKKIR